MSKKHLFTMCDHEQPDCPEIFLDETADAGKQITITDDFDGSVAMSRDQLRVLIESSKAGKLDHV